MSATVSVILVNYRAAEDTIAAITALRAAAPGIPLEVIVSDNDGGRGASARLAQIDGIRLLVHDRNLGFAVAVNRAAATARGEWLLLLNPDTRMAEGALGELIAEAGRHPEAMVLAPRLVHPDGTTQHSARTFYRWRTILARRTPLRAWLRGGNEDRRHLMTERDHRESFEADWVLGACLLMRRADFRALGGLDERFFVYFEDVDLCLRAWRRERTVRYVGQAVVEHRHRRASAGLRSLRAKLYHLASMIRFRDKHGGWPTREGHRRRQAVVFVNDAEGALGERARCFARALGGAVLARHAHAGAGLVTALRLASAVVGSRPRHLHVLDVGGVGLAVEMAGRLCGARVVLDTGDEHFELRRRIDHDRGLGLAIHGAVERLALDLAQVVVARGRGHVESLRRRGHGDVRWIPDGAWVDRLAAARPHPWRVDRGWERRLVVACVGSLLVDRRYGRTQGWELVETLAGTPAEVCGVIVGDGPGRAILERRARELGVEDRLVLLGQVPSGDLPAYLKSFDVCLSTQTDDPVGHARTTGKLPLFMASGRYVLATAVGEASRVLPAEMLVPYRGEDDPRHPERLGRRLRAIAEDRQQLQRGAGLVAVARELFDYPLLARRAADLREG